MIVEERFGCSKEFRKESPEAATRNLGAFAVEAGDGALLVFGVGLADGAGNTQPIADVGDLAKWNAGLSHPVRSGIHSEKEDFLLSATEFRQVVAVSIPRVFEWVVGASNGIGKSEVPELLTKIISGSNEGVLHCFSQEGFFSTWPLTVGVLRFPAASSAFRRLR